MKVFVKSFGCSTNLADGEVLAGCLAEAGYKLTDSISEAEIIVYNTCAVKGPTENRAISSLKRVPANKKLIVAGCLPLINPERLRKEVRFNGIIGPAVGKDIVDVVKRVSNGEKIVRLKEATKTKPPLTLPKIQLNPVISVIPVSYGCLGSCAYCCVIHARGRLRSYSVEEIVERMKKDLASGVREFWVTSQDTACYGKDKNTNLAELLATMCQVEGDFRIRVGMMTPNIVEDIIDDLLYSFASEKIFKFVHLPVQSGDDETLRRMRRFYAVEDFRKIVAAFRKHFPKMTLATDVICGFPGETEEAFKKTLSLIRKVKPDVVNVSKFFARPRTAAAEMQRDFVPFDDVRRRSNVVAKLAKEVGLERNKSWIGWSGEVFVDEVGKVAGSWVGRNYTYKPIVVSGRGNLIGKTLQVKVEEAFSTYLKGNII